MKKYLYLILFFLVCVPAIAGPINSYTLKSPPDDADTIVIYDSDDGSTKKIEVGDISGGGGDIAGGWSDGGTNVFTTTTTDNVAIGTTTPTERLTVVGNVAVTGSVSTTGSESYAEFTELSSAPSTPSSGKGRLYQRTDNHLYYIDDAGSVTDLVDVAGSGWSNAGGNIYPTTSTDSVGIGTSTPTGRLQVISSTFPPVFFERTTAQTASFLGALKLRINSSSVGTDGLGSGVSFYMLDSGGSDSELGIMGFVRNGADNSGAFVVYPSSSGTTSEKMRVTSDGNVGIGTTNPTGLLNVKSSSFPPVLIERTSTGSSSGGTLKLKHKTTAVGDNSLGASASFFIEDSSLTDNEIGNIGYVRSGADDAGDFVIRPSTAGSPVEKVRVTTGGNVGIGTSIPLARLDLGTGDFRVGIGTTTAGTLLCVKSISNGSAAMGYCTGSLTNSICGTCN